MERTRSSRSGTVDQQPVSREALKIAAARWVFPVPVPPVRNHDRPSFSPSAMIFRVGSGKSFRTACWYRGGTAQDRQRDHDYYPILVGRITPTHVRYRCIDQQEVGLPHTPGHVLPEKDLRPGKGDPVLYEYPVRVVVVVLYCDQVDTVVVPEDVALLYVGPAQDL